VEGKGRNTYRFPDCQMLCWALSRKISYSRPGTSGSASWLLRRQRSEGLQFQASPGKQFERPYLKKPFTKLGLVEWLKVKAQSSSPSTGKKKKNPYSYIQSHLIGINIQLWEEVIVFT
jgi:hypothetical protein